MQTTPLFNMASVILAGGCLFLCVIQLSPTKAQSITIPASQCSNSSDCYPADLNGTSLPTKYINCSSQKCVCSDCFYATNSYKSCAYQRCWEYNKTTQTCNDLRKDQRTAFVFSLFLSPLGAANFYIEQNIIGGFQLAIFLGFPILVCGLWLPIFTFCFVCYDADEDLAERMLWPLNVSCVVWILVIMMWWVADIVTFAEDLRTSGDGCPLRHNLGN